MLAIHFNTTARYILYEIKTAQYLNTVKYCLNRNSLESSFVLETERFSVFTGQINRSLLHCDFIYIPVYTGFRFIHESI